MFRHRVLPFVLFVAAVVVSAPSVSAQQNGGNWPGYVQPAGCGRTVWVDMVALDQPFLVNRLGASMPEGMIYALRRDVVPKSGTGPLVQGAVMLRPGKRPRPIVLRANVGDCLAITFCNLLAKLPTSTQPATRYASVHVAGMEVAQTINDDGSYVASNGNATIPPGQTIRYLIRATEEGTYILNSEGAAFGGNNQPNDGAQVTAGLFGMVNVEPNKAEWYRSQVTHEELESAISGFSSIGQPLINYSATFTSGPNTGLPVLNMLDKNNNLIYTDLTAVITGPKHGKFVNPPPTDPSLDQVNIEPNRLDPFREFTIGYHELMDAVQAYPIFGQKTPDLATTLGSSGDAFAINYGTGGIGAEILANRFGLGPMNSCADCRFEEFFLSSWAVGDASMLVDVPSNAPCSNAPYNSLSYNNQVNSGSAASAPCTGGVKGNAPAGITPIRKATKALYPDDPSNVYHSYINDRVIFRVLHTGTGVSHVHHLHAHQWLHSPNSDGSTYLDSQLINPGSHYTEEITFNGSGNRNKVVGDSIFHCHFYPHFAAGMWAMWRSHDVYEVGSPFQTTNFPKQLTKYATRALPDGEIAAGTPIPAIVPMPTLMMPLMPSKVSIQAVTDPNGGPNPVGYEAVVDPAETNVNPGYPFFIPGVGGTRAPHPPLDFAVENNVVQDGGLPRHLLLNATVTTELHTTTDFTKNIDHVNAYELPEDGTPVEKTAMKFHSTCFHPSFRPDGSGPTASDPGFRTNGRPPASGAPYADPGLNPWDPNNPPPPSQQCNGINNWTQYKAAVIQTDLVINKQGWHYPQSRLLTLWSDVLPTIRSQVPQEPFFIRANAGEGVVYWHTNLVPSYYEVDDYQVRTPTDIIGQHIHLVKFDVTASDGAANGYNYEDGTLSYQEVQELVHGVNQCGGLALSAPLSQCGSATNRQTLTLKPPPDTICPASEMAQAPCNGWMGTQTTVQRWFVDPIEDHSPSNNALKEGTRTLRTVFTHDHFGPSTHQQVGLYAALLIEPAKSTWFQSETGTKLHTRDDGGPTTWNAVIESPSSEANTYREFALAMQDFQFAYKSTSKNTLGGGGFPGWADPPNVIESPFGNGNNNLQPQIISSGPTSGTTSFNYRNEPLPFRVQSGSSSDPHAADLSYVYNSNVTRNNTATNSQPILGAPIASGSVFTYPQKPLTEGMEGGDPYTPLLRAYEGDRVQLRVIAGAHMLPHAFTIGGTKWLFEPSFSDSGYRSTQSMGISEHFEMLFRTPRASPSADSAHNFTDYLYMPDASNQKHGIVDGTWGIFRAYKSTADTKVLLPLSTNKTVKPLPPPADADAGYSCPPTAPKKSFTIVARTPSTVIFNSRGTGPAGLFSTGTQITNFYPMVYTVGASNDTGQPAVVRANAGDCIALTVQNSFNPSSQTFNQTSTAAFATNIPLAPSKYAGATPSLLAFDAMKSTGVNVGFNPDQIVPVGSQKTYYWYAGATSIAQDGKITGTPIELGGVNITPSDPLEQDLHGLVAGLVVEPKGAIACLDTYNPALNYPQYGAATVYASGTCAGPGPLLYREFVLITQDDLADVEWYGGLTTIGATQFKAPGGITQLGVNYRIEPMPYRFAEQASIFNANPNLWMGFSNGLVLTDPLTPILSAALGTPTRIHLLHPAGSGNQQVMALHGHVWEELPFHSSSASLGHNRLSQHLGARDSHGTNTSYPIILPSAGGSHPTAGDYLWRTTPSNYLQQGLWGIFRVSASGVDSVKVTSAQWTSGGNLSVYGTTGVFLDKGSNPKNGQRASTVSLYLGHNGQLGNLLSSSVPVGENGLWNFPTKNLDVNDNNWQITAKSPNGGENTAPVILVAAPATPQGAPITTPKQPVGESNRFDGQQRSHHEQNAPTEENEGPAQLTAPAPPPAPPAAKPPNN